jgi:hypothetical protein
VGRRICSLGDRPRAEWQSCQDRNYQKYVDALNALKDEPVGQAHEEVLSLTLSDGIRLYKDHRRKNLDGPTSTRSGTQITADQGAMMTALFTCLVLWQSLRIPQHQPILTGSQNHPAVTSVVKIYHSDDEAALLGPNTPEGMNTLEAPVTALSC